MEFNDRAVRFVAGLHGNERAPVKALQELGIDFVLGNPSAYEQNVRFLDVDLNACFGLVGDVYEHGQAEALLNEISKEELVVDFHTTSAEGEPFVILVSKDMLPLAERTGLGIAVLMSHNIKSGHALINHRDGISVEISGYDSPESTEITKQVIAHLHSGNTKPFEVYEVYDRIVEPGDYANFVEHSGGFIPVLVGEESYDFIGLKARKLNW